MGPILACADTNAATDNIVEGLLKRGINVVRLGQPAKVHVVPLMGTGWSSVFESADVLPNMFGGGPACSWHEVCPPRAPCKGGHAIT